MNNENILLYNLKQSPFKYADFLVIIDIASNILHKRLDLQLFMILYINHTKTFFLIKNFWKVKVQYIFL